MTGYVTFEGAVEPMEWGDATYTVLRLPADVTKTLGKTKRVEGEIADHPVNLALTKAPVIDGVFLWAGKSLLDRIGIEPGERVEIRLKPAPDDQVDVPQDVQNAIRSAGLTEPWDTLTPGKKRSALYQVETAKRAETRAKLIAALLKGLSDA